MTVTVSPLKADAGFFSPGFSVSPEGDIFFSGTLSTTQQLIINGISLFETDDSTVSLSSDIRNSSLTNLGKLERLELKGNLEIVDLTDTLALSIINGTVIISSLTTGLLDNIDIGQTTPALGSFTTLDADIGTVTSLASTTAVIDNLTVSQSTITESTVTTITITSATIASATVASATVASAEISELTSDNIEITQQPTELYHATRKDYVDNRISALSIALGA
jgi:hypothetical protein